MKIIYIGLMASAIVFSCKAVADVDVPMILVTTNGEELDIYNKTSHLTFVSWLRNRTHSRIASSISYGSCNSKNFYNVISKSNGIKYTIMQLIHALSLGDFGYINFIMEILEIHKPNNTENLIYWLHSSFDFPQKDMYALVNNAISLQANLNISYSSGILKIIISIAEKYKLLKKAIFENNFTTAKWLLHAGYKSFDSNSELIELVKHLKEKHLLKEILDYIHKNKWFFVIKLAPSDREMFLDLAVEHEYEDILNYLLDSNFTNVETVLSKALIRNKIKLVDKFRDSLSISFRNQDSEIGLLHCSVVFGDVHIVKKLIEFGTPLDEVDAHGLTPLYKAMESNNNEIIDALVKCGSNYKTATKSGKSLLSTAVSKNDVDVAKKLIDLKANVLEKDADGMSAFQIAISKNEVEMLRVLAESIDNLRNVTISGMSPIHIAVLNGSSSTLELLLNLGADADLPNRDNDTPICLAARADDRFKIVFLAEFGANVSQECVLGNTPLHFAVLKESYSHVRVLTALGADVNASNDDQQTPLYIAAKVNNSKIIAHLLEKKANKYFRTDEGDTLLHISAQHGSDGALNTLINAGLDVNITNYFGETPLSVAVENNKHLIVTLLASKRANIYQVTSSGDTLLHIAVAHYSVETMVTLMKLGLDHLAQNYYGHSSIHRAILSNNYEMVWQMINNAVSLTLDMNLILTAASFGKLESLRALTDYFSDFRVNINIADGKTGWTALSEAVKGNHPSVVRFLIEGGGDLHFESSTGDSLVHIAAINGSTDALIVLHDYKLPIDSKNNKGETPFWLATLYGHFDTMKCLKKLGGDVHVRCISRWQNASLLLPAAYSGNKDSVSWLLSQGLPMEDTDMLGVTALQEASAEGRKEVVRLLLDLGAEVDKADINGWTPLHKAAYSGHPSVAEILINYGATLNPQAVNNLTPLHYAASNGHLDVVTLLCRMKADLDVQDSRGWTPLHWAAYKGHEIVVNELILSEADINVKSTSGYTPLMIAKNRSYKDVEILLLNKGANT